MILYKDNPNLKLKKVETVRGDMEYRRNCKLIRTKYYLIDRDIFEINQKWYRYDGGNLIFNYETNKWIHKLEVSKLQKGLVITDEKEIIFGYFTPNPLKNIMCAYKGSRVLGHDFNILLANGFIEEVSTGMLHCKQDLSETAIQRIGKIYNKGLPSPKIYNVEDDKVEFQKSIELYNSVKIPINKTIQTFTKYLNDITFGVEYEFSQGYCNNVICKNNGLIACRDGSVGSGMEFVTIPLQGAKGLQTIVNLENEFKKRVDVDLNCSLHVHIGTIRQDKLFIVALYVLGKKIQDEIFGMFPYYKTNPDGIKKKNYCKKLKSLSIHPLINFSKDELDGYLTDAHNKIFNFLAEGKISQAEFNKTTRRHPVVNKWDCDSRKYWMNFMNMFFTHRHTVEFRILQATTNATKIINWLFICNAMILYASNNTNKILKSKENISVKDILNIYQDTNPRSPSAKLLSNYLNEYFEDRKAYFKKDFDRGDYRSEGDLSSDKSFEFTKLGLDWKK